jgi:PAS domain S-box-containing protein
MPDYSALRLPLSERLPLVTYTNLVWPVAETVWMSPQVECLTGYRLDEWVGRPGFFESILHPDDRATVLAEAHASRLERRPLSQDYRIIGPDGRVIWIHDESVPILDESGEPELIQGYFVNITRRVELEEQLLHARKTEALGRLAGEIAHDFNNHLTAIRGYADFLEQMLPPGTDEYRYAREIVDASDWATQLTRRLLAFGRREPIEPREVAVDILVQRLAPMLERIAGEQVQMAFDLQPTPAVYADAGQLEQVVVNLVANARDAMPSGGQLSIETSFEAQRVVLSIADDGVGMDEATRAKAFEPFFTTKVRDRGSGLGLSIVDSVVRQSGGAVELDSAPGEGTRIRILLPAV